MRQVCYVIKNHRRLRKCLTLAKRCLRAENRPLASQFSSYYSVLPGRHRADREHVSYAKPAAKWHRDERGFSHQLSPRQ